MAITPSTRGFGYAVLDEGSIFVDWGVKTVKGKEKNAQSLAKVEQLLAQYQPTRLVMANHAGSRRAERIRDLSEDIITLATRRKLKVRRFTRPQINQVFLSDAKGTKHALAETLARMFPEELASHLPPKRRAWMSEDARMDMFEAVALVFMPQTRKTGRGRRKTSRNFASKFITGCGAGESFA